MARFTIAASNAAAAALLTHLGGTNGVGCVINLYQLAVIPPANPPESTNLGTTYAAPYGWLVAVTVTTGGFSANTGTGAISTSHLDTPQVTHGGTVNWFQLTKSDGTTVVCDGPVYITGQTIPSGTYQGQYGDLTIDNSNVITAGGYLSLGTATITFPCS